MPIDRNKQWTEEECRELFMGIVNRYGLTDIGWQVRDREGPGCFGITWRRDTQRVIRKRVCTARWMFTGKLHYKKEKWLYRYVRPVDRLLHILHEAAHATVYVKLQNNWREHCGHGLIFQKTERLLCTQHGYSPTYVRCPGYAKSYLDTVTGETIKFLDHDWYTNPNPPIIFKESGNV